MQKRKPRQKIDGASLFNNPVKLLEDYKPQAMYVNPICLYSIKWAECMIEKPLMILYP